MSDAATQNVLRPGIVELTFGEPDPALLPVEALREAADDALRRHGPGPLAYGADRGPGPLRAAIAARIARTEGVDVGPDDIAVTGGNSQALEQALTVFTAPGDVVLVEDPTYNLAIGTMRDHPVEIVGVPRDGDGIDVDVLAARLQTLRSGGRRVALLYMVPTFHNPAGTSLSPARRAALVDLSRREDLLVIEDDVYRELAYEAPPPPSLWSLDPEAPVLRMGSFSKSLAPGLRTGWVNARRDLRERFVAAGMIVSGGCVSQFNAHVVASFLERGGYDDHVGALRQDYRARRDALWQALRRQLPTACDCPLPAGGFFIWLPLPAGLASTTLLPAAERHGVSFAPGARFSTDGTDTHARLAFSLYDLASLRRSAQGLAAALAELGFH